MTTGDMEEAAARAALEAAAYDLEIWHERYASEGRNLSREPQDRHEMLVRGSICKIAAWRTRRIDPAQFRTHTKGDE